MGFMDDVNESLYVEGSFSVKQAVSAALELVRVSRGSVVLVQPFDDESGTMQVGFREKGGIAALKNWARGTDVVSLFGRAAVVSPTISVTVHQSENLRAQLLTKIEDWTQVDGTFKSSLVGRDQHKAFLTDLGSALKSHDPNVSIRFRY